MLTTGSVLSSSPTKALGFSVEGWFALKKRNFVSRKTRLSNAIYGNSREFSHHHTPLMGPGTCMKISSGGCGIPGL